MSVGILCVATLAGGARRPLAAASHAQGAGDSDSARVLVESLVAQRRLPGFAITVTRGETVLLREGFGLADASAMVKATSETKFRVGSLSKLFTAALLMRLVEQKCVELDAPVGRYLKLPAHLAAVTLRQLSGHVAGVRHYRGAEFMTTTRYASLRDALQIFENDSLIAAPGTRYAYSSYGYTLIGAVLEAACGASYSHLLQRHVVGPLGMRATVLDEAGVRIAQRARLYSLDSTGARDAPPDDLSGRWPSGGVLSSSDDLARLGQAMLRSGFLPAHALHDMMTAQRLTDGNSTNVGIGWRIAVDSGGRRYLHHGGASNGGAAFLLVYPNEQLVLAMATNAFTQWGERDAMTIARVFLRAANERGPSNAHPLLGNRSTCAGRESRRERPVC